jgi:6-pyruvoyltetrahydropterin/6-carboxytetrahydropterin synthase
MMISKQFHFSAAHWLPRHPGKCRNLHGHNYLVDVEVHGPVEKDTQFVMDYALLKAIVQPTIDAWDHKLMNAFVQYSSAENIATHLADLIRSQMGDVEVNRLVVRVSETPGLWATWDSTVREDLLRIDKPAEGDTEWKSPKTKIPIALDSNHKLEHYIEGYDRDIAKVMEDLQALMIVREQTELYRVSLDLNPIIPKG